MDERTHYNELYSVTEEYKKDPKDSRYFQLWQNIVDMVSDHERIIDIGCGPGHLARLLLLNNKSFDKGIDFSDVAIDMAKKMNKEHAHKFEVEDIYELRFYLVYKPTFTCTEVLEHLDYDLHVIDIIPKSSRFIFSVPNYKGKTHKRTYPSIEFITERYPALTFKSITPIPMGGRRIIFLCDTVKK